MAGAGNEGRLPAGAGPFGDTARIGIASPRLALAVDPLDQLVDWLQGDAFTVPYPFDAARRSRLQSRLDLKAL